MIPIYEQGQGTGIGHNLDSFLTRFEKICREHIENNTAKSFAFIFYEFSDVSFRKVLKDQGVFAKLDRLAGDKLSIFYLDIAVKSSVRRFNQKFMSTLGLGDDVTLPCVVFFKLSDEGVKNVEVATIESTALIHCFHELYGIVERYLEDDVPEPNEGLRFMRRIKSATKFVSIEVVREAFRTLLKQVAF